MSIGAGGAPSLLNRAVDLTGAQPMNERPCGSAASRLISTFMPPPYALAVAFMRNGHAIYTVQCDEYMLVTALPSGKLG